jgi:hypothetical protein
MVTLQATIHDSGVTLLRNALLGRLDVHPVRITPHVRADLAKLDSPGSVVCDSGLEGVVEVAIVEEDIGVVIPPVEMPFHGLDRLDDSFQVAVPGEYDECSVRSGL